MILEQLKMNAEEIQFNDVITYIDSLYQFTPTEFKNGDLTNEANQNNGSCKIFSFAKLEGLSESDTLKLFGDFYRKDVLRNPQGEDHQNIRNFIKYGWSGISFQGEALQPKK